jgi:hypothetical protein
MPKGKVSSKVTKKRDTIGSKMAGDDVDECSSDYETDNDVAAATAGSENDEGSDVESEYESDEDSDAAPNEKAKVVGADGNGAVAGSVNVADKTAALPGAANVASSVGGAGGNLLAGEKVFEVNMHMAGSWRRRSSSRRATRSPLALAHRRRSRRSWSCRTTARAAQCR